MSYPRRHTGLIAQRQQRAAELAPPQMRPTKPKFVTDEQWEAALADAERVKQLRGRQTAVRYGPNKWK